MDEQPEALERRSRQVDQAELLSEGVLLGVAGEAARGEQRVPVVVPAQRGTPLAPGVVLVHVVDDTVSVADVRQTGRALPVLRLHEKPDRQAEGCRREELAQHVDLMVGAPAADEQPVPAGL